MAERETLTGRLRGFIRTRAERVAEFFGDKPAKPAKPAEPKPPPLPPMEQPPPVQGGRGDAESLMEQLSALSTATNEIYKRLSKMGYKEAAEAIVAIKPLAPQAPPAVPAPPVVPQPQLEEPPPQAPPALPKQQLPKPQRRTPDLKGSNMYIDWMPPGQAYRVLEYEWRRASIGSKRDDQGNPVDPLPPFAPRAIATGSPMDPGVQIPPGVLRSEGAFVAWANDHGFDQGLSIEIDGIIPRAGRSIISAADRPRITVLSGPGGRDD
jgi:hypothetical protein